MALNPYFTSAGKTVQGDYTEQDLYEEMIIECIQIWGIEMFYIPRTLVAMDDILGEDRLSEFQNAYPIEVYFESVTGFEGQGQFMEKFGLSNEQSATITMARKRWTDLIGSTGESILPNRPAEGDLMYFPLTNSLFEIKFVEHQNVFYQVGKLYTYQLEIELFQYASERINTGVPEIDVFETLKSQDPAINDVEVPNSFGDNNKLQDATTSIVVDKNNIFGDII